MSCNLLHSPLTPYWPSPHFTLILITSFPLPLLPLPPSPLTPSPLSPYSPSHPLPLPPPPSPLTPPPTLSPYPPLPSHTLQDQYVFLHDAILESLNAGLLDAEITVDRLAAHMQELAREVGPSGKTGYVVEFEVSYIGTPCGRRIGNHAL